MVLCLQSSVGVGGKPPFLKKKVYFFVVTVACFTIYCSSFERVICTFISSMSIYTSRLHNVYGVWVKVWRKRCFCTTGKKGKLRLNLIPQIGTQQ